MFDRKPGLFTGLVPLLVSDLWESALGCLGIDFRAKSVSSFSVKLNKKDNEKLCFHKTLAEFAETSYYGEYTSCSSNSNHDPDTSGPGTLVNKCRYSNYVFSRKRTQVFAWTRKVTAKFPFGSSVIH